MDCDELRASSKHDAKKREPSDRISARRKALFPTENDNSDSDLGPMSPLSDSVKPARECYFSSLGDYVIFKGDFGNENSTPTAASRRAPSPTYLSPIQHTADASDACYETPIKDSPTKSLKTPHDTSNTNVKLPRIPRKTNLDSSDVDVETCGGDSPDGQSSNRLDASFGKNSKVRTALFPESESDISLPAKSFYSTSDTSIGHRARSLRDHVGEAETVKRKPKSRSTMYLCNRRRGRGKNRFGQINAGVRHGIRRPKRKKLVKSDLLRTALEIIENSPLNDYLKTVVAQRARSRIEGPSSEEVEPGSVSPPPDPNKKFFKSNRMRGTVTVNKNIKLQVSKGKIDLLEGKGNKRKARSKTGFDHSEKAESDELKQHIASIIDMLDGDKENNRGVVAQTVAVNDRKRKLPDETTSEGAAAELLLSPTSQMCDMASGLAINSPKRAKLNINKILEETTATTNIFNKGSGGAPQPKLFPIFYPGSNTQSKAVVVKPSSKTVNAKQWKMLPKDQMLLDAGQKRFGATQCPECGIIYHMGDPTDEIMHRNYHNSENILHFNGWKHENVVATCKTDRIIKINPSDPKIWWKKVNDLMEVVNRDLGFYETNLDADKSTILLYIRHKAIAGCVVAEPKSLAHMMLPNLDGVDTCSEESYAVKCGVSRVWVAREHRKQGVATALLNCLRRNFVAGYFLRNEEIAFSSPTEMGHQFAVSYFKTPNYLMYMM